MRPARILILVLTASAAGLLAAVLFLGRGERTVRTSLAVTEALSSDTAGYARADRPRAFEFPEDHGPHPDFRTEWWYYTGNLETAAGRHFGFQLTFFRTALRPDTSSRGKFVHAAAATSSTAGYTTVDTTWSTRQLYMAHFALSDAASGRFLSSERLSRGAAGLAGAQAVPYRVWLEDWSAAGPDADSVRLMAQAGEVGVDLTLQRAKPIVLQGNDGLDAKGEEPGNASYYYSMTRLETGGSVTVDGETHHVDGLSWMDREWSTSALGHDVVGWDWFALHLDSGRELMYYRLRQRDGSPSPYSNGVVVGAHGELSRLSEDDVVLHHIDHWESPVTGRRYPVEWSLRIPALGIDLTIEPFLRPQELDHSVTYWEGAVRVEGSDRGVGFVELTGYGDAEEGFGDGARLR